MNTLADKTQKQNRSTAAAVSQKQSINESKSQFVDNRPEIISHKKLLEKMATHSSQTMQLQAIVTMQTDTATKKKIRAEGMVEEFQDGTSAGSTGWLGVARYRSEYSVSDDTNEDKGEIGPLLNVFTTPEAGHILGKQNGGDGKDPKNIFAQDGGTNNGPYKAFENKMRKDMNKYDADGEVEFTSDLRGDQIRSGIVADEGLTGGMDISSDDSD